MTIKLPDSPDPTGSGKPVPRLKTIGKSAYADSEGPRMTEGQRGRCPMDSRKPEERRDDSPARLEGELAEEQGLGLEGSLDELDLIFGELGGSSGRHDEGGGDG